ncbi:sialyltransferase [Chloropicon primus]|uniref:beta-galactoside alpha-(2,6)-sialyltransferase n=1 Tax=Chloropicon primus TaxID=1764295 RepID=A0A5B8MNU6_9CHLO|nr:sialyltransferase [Chloropicon primus]UPR01201.1 sialyltransferase [Chloropicon primus]|eukprot:QDZ21981.1 sialyltransferase [Chloropicon primus]
MRSRKGKGNRRVLGLSTFLLAVFACFLLYDASHKLASLGRSEILQTRQTKELSDHRAAVGAARDAARQKRVLEKSPLSPEELGSLRRKWASAVNLPDASELDAYSKKVRVENLFLHQGNYKRLLRHYLEDMDGGDGNSSTSGSEGTDSVDGVDAFITNRRSFPASLRFLRNYNFDTCAVVGNSGSLLNATFGKCIDSHHVVLRFNQAPRGDSGNNLKRQVGSKTTFRLINTRWTHKYGDGSPSLQGLPLETGVTMVATRAHPRLYESLAEMLKKKRPDVKLLYLSSRVISSARNLLVAFRRKLVEDEAGEYEKIPGGNTPSSGLVGVYALLQACRTLDVYGFGLDDSAGDAQGYHYFDILSPAHGKRKDSMNPTHSFDTEKLLLRSLQAGGALNLCEARRGDRKARRECGLQVQNSPNRRAADSSAGLFDMID